MRFARFCVWMILVAICMPRPALVRSYDKMLADDRMRAYVAVLRLLAVGWIALIAMASNS